MSDTKLHWSHAMLKDVSPPFLNRATLELGLAPESCYQTNNGTLWIWEDNQGIQWQPSTDLAQARRLALDGLRRAGWSLEYTTRAVGHLLQYDGCCHAYKGRRSETVFWGGPGSADTEATALTRLACWCAVGEEG